MLYVHTHKNLSMGMYVRITGGSEGNPNGEKWRNVRTEKQWNVYNKYINLWFKKLEKEK